MRRLIFVERTEDGLASSAMASYVFARICDERHQTYVVPGVNAGLGSTV